MDGSVAVQKALSAILRTGESYGAGHLIDILVGNATEKVRDRRHDELPTFGVGQEYNRSEWQAIFRQIMGRDLARPDPERHGALRMTEAARPILRGEQDVQLRKDSLTKTASRPQARSLVSDEDAPLLAALKAQRRALAEAARVPAYVIFNDRTLIEMAETRPANLDQMAAIGGVGAKKLERYGQVFLEVINGEAATVHPTRRKLAGSDAGKLFDRLIEVQVELSRGADGTGKFLSCTHSTLRQIAERKPNCLDSLQRIQGMGENKIERFGPAFLDVVREAS